MSIRIDKDILKTALKYLEKTETGSFVNHTVRTSETYTAGEEKTKYTKDGHGHAEVVNFGTGDPEIITRIYYDKEGTPETQEIAGNVFAIIMIGFTLSLSIKTYRATAGSGYCSAISVVGFSRVV